MKKVQAPIFLTTKLCRLFHVVKPNMEFNLKAASTFFQSLFSHLKLELNQEKANLIAIMKSEACGKMIGYRETINRKKLLVISINRKKTK